MKTTKLILSIALVALVTTSFGQLSLKERIFPNRNQEVAYFTADYKTETSKIENWMHDLRSWAVERNSGNTSDTPVVLGTIKLVQAEVVYEETMAVERWMSAPFGIGLAEEELDLESWMITPFSGSIAEEPIQLESWMASPFEANEEIEVEGWMNAIWI